jgi:hypothetical protein
MKDLTSALKDIAHIFETLSAKYAVMGGVAVRVYGIPRPTYDVDFTVALARDRLPSFFTYVTDYGYTVAPPYLNGWIDEVGGMPVVKVRLYLQNHGIDIDVFLAESEFQQSLLSRRQREEVEGAGIWFVSPEDLILLKLIAGRPRDLVDVRDVLFTQGRLDEAYLRRWAAALGVSNALENALSEEYD